MIGFAMAGGSWKGKHNWASFTYDDWEAKTAGSDMPEITEEQFDEAKVLMQKKMAYYQENGFKKHFYVQVESYAELLEKRAESDEPVLGFIETQAEWDTYQLMKSVHGNKKSRWGWGKSGECKYGKDKVDLAEGKLAA